MDEFEYLGSQFSYMKHVFVTNIFSSLNDHLCWFLSTETEDSKKPVAFESGGNMGEELDSLRATIDNQHLYDSDSNSTHPGSPRRRKRFLSYPRYVELMVTADAKMVRHHGRNLEHYILTIMSVVSKTMFLKIILMSQCWRCCDCYQMIWGYIIVGELYC